MQSSSDVAYKVGDMVTIREWNSLAEEFGYNLMCPEVKRIMAPFTFTSIMGLWCGKKASIIEVKYSNATLDYTYGLYFSSTDVLSYHGEMAGYIFSKEMFVETYAEPNCDLRDKFAEGDFDETLI